MRDELETLRVTDVIVHQVPKKVSGEMEPPLGLSEAASSITSELGQYIRERVIKSLTASAFDVVADENALAVVPDEILAFLSSSGGDLVERSLVIAKHLYAVQDGNNPAGLLCVAAATVNGRRTLAILKLEMEQAVRLETARVGGRSTFDLTLLRDLVLNNHTRVFKAALFQRQDGDGPLIGLVSDKQRGSDPRSPMANFFLSQFLGCKLADTPNVRTRDFYTLVEQFINEHVTDPERQARYHMALLTELTNSEETVAPEEFASSHFEGSDSRQFTANLNESGFEAYEPFVKDVHLVEKRLRRVQVEFSNGVTVIAPLEVMERDVLRETLADGRLRLEITDSVKQFRGA
ncbi:MAG: nucleoid-associated protein [Actinomycetota bacterium]